MWTSGPSASRRPRTTACCASLVDDAQRASSILLEHGFILTMTPVVAVAVAVPDRPGGLSQVLGVLSAAGMDIEYMYSVFGQKNGLAYMIFRVADPAALEDVLTKNGLASCPRRGAGNPLRRAIHSFLYERKEQKKFYAKRSFRMGEMKENRFLRGSAS